MWVYSYCGVFLRRRNERFDGPVQGGSRRWLDQDFDGQTRALNAEFKDVDEFERTDVNKGMLPITRIRRGPVWRPQLSGWAFCENELLSCVTCYRINSMRSRLIKGQRPKRPKTLIYSSRSSNASRSRRALAGRPYGHVSLGFLAHFSGGHSGREQLAANAKPGGARFHPRGHAFGCDAADRPEIGACGNH